MSSSSSSSSARATERGAKWWHLLLLLLASSCRAWTANPFDQELLECFWEAPVEMQLSATCVPAGESPVSAEACDNGECRVDAWPLYDFRTTASELFQAAPSEFVFAQRFTRALDCGGTTCSKNPEGPIDFLTSNDYYSYGGYATYMRDVLGCDARGCAFGDTALCEYGTICTRDDGAMIEYWIPAAASSPAASPTRASPVAAFDALHKIDVTVLYGDGTAAATECATEIAIDPADGDFVAEGSATAVECGEHTSPNFVVGARFAQWPDILYCGEVAISILDERYSLQSHELTPGGGWPSLRGALPYDETSTVSGVALYESLGNGRFAASNVDLDLELYVGSCCVPLCGDASRASVARLFVVLSVALAALLAF